MPGSGLKGRGTIAGKMVKDRNEKSRMSERGEASDVLEGEGRIEGRLGGTVRRGEEAEGEEEN